MIWAVISLVSAGLGITTADVSRDLRNEKISIATVHVSSCKMQNGISICDKGNTTPFVSAPVLKSEKSS